MEIIKRAVQGPHKFKVKSSFMQAERSLQIGEEVELKEPEASAMVKIGKVTPADLPEVGEYIALHPFTLPGKSEKFSCKKLENIEIKGDDALKLMLEGIILPANDSQWRPLNRRLRRGPDRSAADRAAMRKNDSDSQLYALGIHPSQHRK
jgi:hypothetical protein